jgi:amidohydrolase
MRDLEKYIIEKRRFLHENPEIGFACEATSAYIEKELKALGIKDVKNAGKHSLVAVIENGGNKTFGLRADFDALMIEEETGLAFSSKNKGYMHACGHDAHTAMLLGAAKYLQENKSEWQGTVKLIFQEAEEGPDPGGAYYLIQTDLLKDVDEFYALHVSPAYLTGELAINYGAALAAADTFNITFKGVGTHAAYPHLGIDPIMMQAEFITRLQTIVSRKTDTFQTAVVSVGKVSAGTTFNIIPDKALLSGTVRTFSEDCRTSIERDLMTLAKTTSEYYGGSYEMEYLRGYDPTINDFDCVKKVIEVSKSVFDKIIILEQASMGAEDFSRYLTINKGAIAWLGVGHEDKVNHNIHNSRFNLNEEALIKGTNVFINIVKKG